MKTGNEPQIFKIFSISTLSRHVGLVLLLTLLGTAVGYGQATNQESDRAAAAAMVDTVDLTDFFVFGESPEVRWKYQFGKSSAGFIDYFLKDLERFGGFRWHVRVRIYSTGQTDTVLYRRDEEGVHHVIPAARRATASMTMPSVGWVGRRWAEADQTWTYTIRSTAGTLESEDEKYEGLLVIRAKEEYPAEGKKPRIYDLYFARNIGMVATVVDITLPNEEGETGSVALVRLVETEGLDG